MHTRATLARDMARLGIRAGDCIMVHASVRAVGEVAGGPDQIHLALGDVLTGSGTILMYAGCPRHVDEVGRGNLSPAEEADVLDQLPAFDPLTARSARDHGVLVEFLRTWPGSRVNPHPARFVALGPHAGQLFSSQPWDDAFGHGSALERLVELDGRILLLGSDHDAVTFLHYVEHIADFPGKRVARFQVPVLENGVRIWREMKEIDTSSAGAHPNWPDRFFAAIVDGFLAETGNRGGLVGDARCHLLPVRSLLAYARPIMEQLARKGPGILPGHQPIGIPMSVFSAAGLLSREQADQYTNALLGLLGDQDPIRILRETPDWLHHELASFPAERLRTPEAAGKWSAATVFAHLADAELVTGFRLRLILAQDHPPLTPYDQDRWATRLHHDRVTPDQSLELFTVLRRANLPLWEHATAEELTRAGLHAERGEESVDRQRRLMAGHDLLHRRQLSRIRQAVTKP